jgi:hypothetical protein
MGMTEPARYQGRKDDPMTLVKIHTEIYQQT